ncbi:hypothetical protein B7H17_16990 [Pseudomonas putida]|uniref:Uncharacterized protein n=1 Tax=Pseudomonas putida TaxID=303 RepID=A0A1X0ZTJ1_PSEPU|nr:hypothetical protein B7H17_16990 [Pseudomonas putida]
MPAYSLFSLLVHGLLPVTGVSVVWPHDAVIIEPRRLHVLALVEQRRTALMEIDRFDTEIRFCAT